MNGSRRGAIVGWASLAACVGFAVLASLLLAAVGSSRSALAQQASSAETSPQTEPEPVGPPVPPLPTAARPTVATDTVPRLATALNGGALHVEASTTSEVRQQVEPGDVLVYYGETIDEFGRPWHAVGGPSAWVLQEQTFYVAFDDEQLGQASGRLAALDAIVIEAPDSGRSRSSLDRVDEAGEAQERDRGAQPAEAGEENRTGAGDAGERSASGEPADVWQATELVGLGLRTATALSDPPVNVPAEWWRSTVELLPEHIIALGDPIAVRAYSVPSELLDDLFDIVGGLRALGVVETTGAGELSGDGPGAGKPAEVDPADPTEADTQASIDELDEPDRDPDADLDPDIDRDPDADPADADDGDADAERGSGLADGELLVAGPVELVLQRWHGAWQSTSPARSLQPMIGLLGNPTFVVDENAPREITGRPASCWSLVGGLGPLGERAGRLDLASPVLPDTTPALEAPRGLGFIDLTRLIVPTAPLEMVVPRRALPDAQLSGVLLEDSSKRQAVYLEQSLPPAIIHKLRGRRVRLVADARAAPSGDLSPTATIGLEIQVGAVRESVSAAVAGRTTRVTLEADVPLDAETLTVRLLPLDITIAVQETGSAIFDRATLMPIEWPDHLTTRPLLLRPARVVSYAPAQLFTRALFAPSLRPAEELTAVWPEIAESSWSEEEKRKLLVGELAAGMSRQMVRLAWGDPPDRARRPGGLSRWDYPNRSAAFTDEDGLISWTRGAEAEVEAGTRCFVDLLPGVPARETPEAAVQRQ